MATIKFENQTLESKQEESVLDCLVRNNVEIPNSCRSGICQSCIMQATKGTPSTSSTKSLSEAKRRDKYFLSCLCLADQDLELVRAGDLVQKVQTKVEQKEFLTKNIFRLILTPEKDFSYFPGQYLTVLGENNLARSYSIASIPADGKQLELHIKHFLDGKMSNWLANSVNIGHEIKVIGAFGECYYKEGDSKQKLLLAGTGTGLAPLYGILKQAIYLKHTGDIHIVHGSLNPEDQYLAPQLEEFANKHSNIFYHKSIFNNSSNPENKIAIDAYIKPNIEIKNDWRAYICGDENVVKKLQMQVFMAGISMKSIHADLFIASKN